MKALWGYAGNLFQSSSLGYTVYISIYGLGCGVQGVSVTGCAGAGSTQARTPICMSTPPLALHPRVDLHGFRVLLNSDHAPVLSSVSRLPELEQNRSQAKAEKRPGLVLVKWLQQDMRTFKCVPERRERMSNKLSCEALEP